MFDHLSCSKTNGDYFLSAVITSLHETQPKSKLGAEKIAMNIVVVGQD